MKAGKDKPQRSSSAATTGSGGNTIHFTYVVSTTKTRTKEEPMSKAASPAVHLSCPQCRWPTHAASKFCSQCGARLPHDERMAENKRGWTVVRDDEEEQVASSESSRGQKEDKPRTYKYHMRKELLREAAGLEERGRREREREKIRASPEEVLAGLPHMTKEEKKRIQKALEREEKQAAYDGLDKGRLLLPYYESSEDEERDHTATGSMTQGPYPPLQPR